MEKYCSFSELLVSKKKSHLPAIVSAKGNKKKSMTYAKLYSNVMDEAARLRKSKYSSELIVCDHAPETVIHIFASVIAGKTIIMGDESLSDEALCQMAAGTRAESVFSTEDELKKIIKPNCAPASGNGAEGEGKLIFFTSGTSDKSKAAILTSAAFCSSAWNGQSMLPCGEGDIILSLLPLAHVFGFVCTLLWGLAYGACIALGRGPRYFMEDCKFFAPTILPSVPSMTEFLFSADVLNPELKTVLIGAAPCTQCLIDQLHTRGISVRFGYGLTETASGVAISMNDENPFAMYPCPDADIRIERDSEISISSTCLMLGYLDGSGLTQDGRFMTGDLGFIDDDGAVHITGRKKDILVLPDGTKIFCAGYERDLSEMMGTQEIAVIMRDEKPVLVVGPGTDLDKAKDAVKQYNKDLPRSQQLCGVYVNEKPLPRTATGKLCRWAVK